jgi:dihydrofolate reductase
MIKIISAISLNNIIGSNNTLPWAGNYKEDLQFFKKMTINQTVIMGSSTYNSIGKPLPNRRNLVLTRRLVPRNIGGVEHFLSLEAALQVCDNDCWIIGGGKVYEKAIQFADEMYITTIPEIIDGENLIYFPKFDESKFSLKEKIELNKEKNLYCNIYSKI